jgi:hypothetical protein
MMLLLQLVVWLICCPTLLASSSDGPGGNAPATTGVLGGAPGAKRTLVLLDSVLTKLTHSTFLNSLQQRGHQLSFHLASSGDLDLQR